MAKHAKSAGNPRGNFRQFLLRFAVFAVLVFAVLYANYSYASPGLLEHPLAWALQPVVHLAILCALFCFFARNKTSRMPQFGKPVKDDWIYLVVALLFIATRYLMGSFAFSKYITAAGLFLLGLFIFGIPNLIRVFRAYEREIVLTGMTYLFLWAVFGMDLLVTYVLKGLF